MGKEDVLKLAQQIKAKIDMLVNDYGVDAIKPLEDIEKMNNWIILQKESSETILLSMKMYLEGVITTLKREKK